MSAVIVRALVANRRAIAGLPVVAATLVTIRSVVVAAERPV
ncbi:hypothetical protein [Streptococcus sanguinis]